MKSKNLSKIGDSIKLLVMGQTVRLLRTFLRFGFSAAPPFFLFWNTRTKKGAGYLGLFSLLTGAAADDSFFI